MLGIAMLQDRCVAGVLRLELAKAPVLVGRATLGLADSLR